MHHKLLRPARFVGSSALMLAVAGFAWAAALHQDEPADRVLAAHTTTGGSGSCDVDGVRVSYASQYAPAEYRVDDVTVRDISSTCGGAEVSVTLSDQNDVPLADGAATAQLPANGPATFALSLPNGGPLARSVYNVDVEIAGGTTPIPTGCTVNRFDFTYVGDLTDDANIIGTNGSDLIYGLSGDDTITGMNGKDCVVGGEGNDTMTGGNHVSFVDGGAGNDTITLGNASNMVIGGSGTDTIKVGNGDNKITVGTGANTVAMGNGKNTVTIVGGTSNTTCVLPKSSKTTNAGLAGCKTIEWTP